MKNILPIKNIFTSRSSSTYLKKYFFYFLVLFNGLLFSQKENSKWYFGIHAAVDFMTTPPSCLSNSAIGPTPPYGNILEGTASVADTAGNLLFYTNGVTAWNKNHQVMANGTGLLGHVSATQGALAVKQPGSNTIYYLFTLDLFGYPNGMRYSLIDMSLAGGTGSITAKNILVYTPSAEKLCGVVHCNGKDVWIITHENPGLNFRTYLLTSAGLSVTPVLSPLSANTSSNQAPGYLKASPDGTKLGMAVGLMSVGLPTTAPSYELYDFDNATGVVSNQFIIPNVRGGYGCEFSPDGTKFYGHNSSTVLQWDLCAGSDSAIIASQHSVTSQFVGVEGMQRAPDGKIYGAQTNALGVINNPNAAGAACNFVNMGFPITTGIVSFGLPNFVTVPFKPAISLTKTITCQTVNFAASQATSVVTAACYAPQNYTTSFVWSFGDAGSGAANSSTLANPSHVYSAMGTYTVEFISYAQCSTDTVRSVVVISKVDPLLSIAGTYAVCKGDKRIYTVSGANTYTWSTSAHTTTVSLSPTVTTTYSVTGTGTNTCRAIKEFTIVVNKCTGIEEITETTNTFRIYPNPTNGNLFIETETGARLRILNALGKLMFEGSFESGNHSIDVTDFTNGIYIVQAIIGKNIKTSRFVKLE